MYSLWAGTLHEQGKCEVSHAQVSYKDASCSITYKSEKFGNLSVH